MTDPVVNARKQSADHDDRCASLLGEGCDCRDPFTWESTVPEGSDPSTDPAQPVNRQMVTDAEARDTPGRMTDLVHGSPVSQDAGNAAWATSVWFTVTPETRLQTAAQRGTFIAAQHWQEGSVG